MSLSGREFWAVVHGLILGSAFLLAFAGGLAGLYSLRPEWLTVTGLQERTRRLMAGTWIMAVAAWLTVYTGTYIVYPWYRVRPPEGTTDFANFPRSLLLSKPETRLWHTFGMEWKEHVAWFAPLLATAVAYVVVYYGAQLAKEDKMRRLVITLFITAFAVAAVAGLFGAFITKAAPVR